MYSPYKGHNDSILFLSSLKMSLTKLLLHGVWKWKKLLAVYFNMKKKDYKIKFI